MEDPLQLEKLNGVVLVIVRVQLLILEIEGKAMALHNKSINGNILVSKCMKEFTFSNFDFLDLMNMMRS